MRTGGSWTAILIQYCAVLSPYQPERDAGIKMVILNNCISCMPPIQHVVMELELEVRIEREIWFGVRVSMLG